LKKITRVVHALLNALRRTVAPPGTTGRGGDCVADCGGAGGGGGFGYRPVGCYAAIRVETRGEDGCLDPD